MADQQKGLGERVGNEAHDAPDTGNPIKVGGVGTDARASAVSADGDRVDASFTREGEARTKRTSFVDAGNSSTAPLGISATFTGTGISTLGYNNVVVNAFVASGGGALLQIFLEWSSDNTNWDHSILSHSVSVTAQDTGSFQSPIRAEFFRIRALNQIAAQTTLRLQTIFQQDAPGAGSTQPSGSQDSNSGVLSVGGRAIADPITSVFVNNDRASLRTDLAGNLRVTSQDDFPVFVAGTAAHDAADAGDPVKVGGVATAAVATAVDEGDRVDASYDLEGRARVIIDSVAIAAHDAPDTGNPLKVGGTATAALPAAVGEGDRVQASFDLEGRIRTTSAGGSGQVEGSVAHDGVDVDNPLKTGGHANAARRAAVAEDDIADASFTLEGEQRVVQTSVVDAGNSSTSTLAASATFTGTGVSTLGYNTVQINSAYTAAGTPAGTVRFEWSSDNTNWDHIDLRPTVQGIDSLVQRHRSDVKAEFFRAVYVNGSEAQTAFRFQTLLQQTALPANELSIDGDIQHGQPEDVSFQGSRPVKIGGRGTTGVPAAVDNLDRVMASFSTQGQLRVIPYGNTLHDSADIDGPQKMGGHANAATRTAVGEDDRVDASYDLEGRARVIIDDIAIVAHDAADAGNPLKVGGKASEFAADPPQVSADADRVDALFSPQGHLWTLGGHPNIISAEYMTTGSQTNDPIIDTVAAGSHIVITEIEFLVSSATTNTPQVRIGFGAATVPAEPATGAVAVPGVVMSHGAAQPGSGVVRGNGAGVIAVGGSGEELRITCSAPSSGKITVMVSYFITTL